jgi:hypothetical protein
MLVQSLAIIGLVFVVMLITTVMKYDKITHNAIKAGTSLSSMWIIAFIFLSITSLIFYWSFYYAFINPFLK